MELPKAYDPAQEDDIAARERATNLYNPDKLPGDRPEAFSIVLPPPNVTGTLHMGHAAMLAIEDVMVRFARLRGKKTLWLPGVDHAAIATQSKVEKLLWNEEKKTRHDLGREVFLDRVKAFAQASHDTIVNQCQKMGASLDWSREAYTLDEARNHAVNTAFKKMYDEGLIYQGYRVVNWDPVGQTVIADDEIVYKEEKTKFYYFKYGPFEIGTARPETKFGDKYIVVHPEDPRYAQYEHGQKLTVEWINGSIEATVIKDVASDMEFGTGAMTITPWHSLIDFDVAEKYHLDKEQIIDLRGRLLPVAGEFAGMSIGEAREKIVAKLEVKGLLVRTEENYVHNIGTAERTGGIIEPQVLRQWFVDVNKEFTRDGKQVTLKSLMQDAVRLNKIKIIPERFEKTYFHWIDNLRDWCISRQIWFGHRVPVWYRGDEIAVGAAPTGEDWERDPDTLDTWFSSGLWTFSTLGWPDENASDFKTYHPTTILETGYDIIFFWVARMILMSTYLLDEVPFKTVYLHGLVRDDIGRKMSKSLENIINPLDMIAEYGADATRLSLLVGNTPGNDMKLSVEKVAGFRNFTNKLWNIARFVLTTVEDTSSPKEPPQPKTLADQWILSRLATVTDQVTRSLEAHDLSHAGEFLREFTWNDVADWYLECAKVQRKEEVLKSSTDAILLFVLERLLTLWHPFMPFVTQALWEAWRPGEWLLIASWPKIVEAHRNPSAEVSWGQVMELVTTLRTVRAEQQIAPSLLVEASFVSDDETSMHLLTEPQIASVILTLGRLSSWTQGKPGEGKRAISAQMGGVTLFVEVPVPDLARERERLEKELEAVTKRIASLAGQLANTEFISKAPASVVSAMRTTQQEASELQRTLQERLATLSS